MAETQEQPKTSETLDEKALREVETRLASHAIGDFGYRMASAEITGYQYVSLDDVEALLNELAATAGSEKRMSPRETLAFIHKTLKDSEENMNFRESLGDKVGILELEKSNLEEVVEDLTQKLDRAGGSLEAVVLSELDIESMRDTLADAHALVTSVPGNSELAKRLQNRLQKINSTPIETLYREKFDDDTV